MLGIKWSTFQITVVILLVHIQKSFCSTTSQSPCTFNNKCTCYSQTVGSKTDIEVYCRTTDAQFPSFPNNMAENSSVTYRAVVVEGAFQQIPAYAFGSLNARTILLRRNATDMTLPLTVSEHSFLGFRDFGNGTYQYQPILYISITFENFLGLTTVPTKALTYCATIEYLIFIKSNFSTLYGQPFLNVPAHAVILDECNIHTIDSNALQGAKNMLALALPNNFLNDVPKEALSRISDTLQTFDISGNNLTSLTENTFATFSNLLHYIFANNPITNIPLGSLNGVKENDLYINSLPDLTSLDVSITIGMPYVGVLNVTNCPQMTTLEISEIRLPDSMSSIYSPASVQYISDDFKNWLSLRQSNTLYIASENYACNSSMYWMAPFLCSQEPNNVRPHIVIAENAKCSNGKQMQQYLNENTNYVCGSTDSSASSVSTYSMLVAFVLLLSTIFSLTNVMSLAV